MTVDDLITELSKPIYILRLARPRENEDSDMGHSCKTRAKNAREEIYRIVMEFAGKGTVE